MGTMPSPDIHAAPRCHTEHVEALIQECAPLIKYIAQRLASRLPASVCLEDLISAGVIGLLDALHKYDPQHANVFSTYAAFRIRGAMLDDLRELDWVPRSVRDKEQALTKAYEELERRHGRPAADAEVAAWLALDLDTFHAWLTQVRGVSLLSLDTPVMPYSRGGDITLRDILSVDDALSPPQMVEARHLTRLIAAAIEALPAQEKIVIALYYNEELTMQEISKVLKLTASRVSQVHTKAIFHLRAALQSLKQDAYARVG